jgi:hypothetical protein
MRRAPINHADRGYLPAMGCDVLLPLYDTVSRLLGAASPHRQLIASRPRSSPASACSRSAAAPAT